MKQVRQLEVRIHSHCADKSALPQNSCISYSMQIPYQVELFFLRLPSPEMAVERVAGRVKQGGHNISEHIIRRRFAAGLDNFQQIYRPLVNAWALYDNAGTEPLLLEWGVNT